MNALSIARLYGILDIGYVDADHAIRTANQMLEGGIDILQLRAKSLAPVFIRNLAGQLAPLCREAGVPFIINDHAEIARMVDADGIHVGQDDLSLAEARRIAGENKIVGRSTHSLVQAQTALAEGADYIGFGPIFPTPTKPDYVPIGLQDIFEAHQCVPIPIFCIGGIKRENLHTLIQSGARRVVIVSGILQAADIPGYIRDCKSLLE